MTSHAAKYNTKSLELLIERFGEKVLYVKDRYGDTPLHSAAASNRDSFKFLIDMLHKTDLFTERNDGGDTALHVAILSGHGDLLKPLIDKHPEITQSFLSEKNIKGNTPLHFAAEYDKDFFALLIEKFGEQALEVKNNSDHTVLYVAAERNKDSLTLLIEKFPAIIESLLSAQDKDGHTPLHLSTGNKGAFKLLIEKFPEEVKSLLNVENRFGKTVLKYALSDCPDALPKEYQTTSKELRDKWKQRLCPNSWDS